MNILSNSYTREKTKETGNNGLIRPKTHFIKFKKANADTQVKSNDHHKAVNSVAGLLGRTHLVHSLVAGSLDAQVDHGVLEGASHVVLQRQVVDALEQQETVLENKKQQSINHQLREL